MYPIMLTLAGALAALFAALLTARDIYYYPVCKYCGDNMRTKRVHKEEARCSWHGALVPKKELHSSLEGGRYITREHTLFVRAT